jgi:transcriptional regulator with GAF, ATPase, and Fis domain/pSer/pThr/pTyr-binding forkhead associated (FHA) protein
VIVLEVIRSGSAPTRVALPPPVATIGRAPTCTLMLPVGHLSGEHAQLSREGSDVVIRDLRSTNGTAVDRGGQRYAIDAASRRDWVLAVGDEIVLGDALDPVRLRVLELAGSGAVMATTPAPGADGDADDHDLEGRLVASRSIVDLVAVRGHLEHDPVSALRVYKALQPLGARLDPAAVIAATVDATFEVLARATHVAVLMRDETEKERFVLAQSRSRPGVAPPPGAGEPDPVRASRAVLRRVLGQRAALLIADAQTELAASESIHAGQIRSMLALPLWRGDEIIGLIQADNRASAGMFDESDLELGLLLGSQAALAIDNANLVRRLRVAEEQLRGENGYLRRREGAIKFTDIVGESAAMKAVFAQLARVIETRVTVCIEGETGTGKELIASAVHHQSPRASKMFVAQNCAALPENLLESELFGHRRGAFTSADSDKKGLFEIADGGTLFLDEVGEMPLALQAKLLRVLQEGTIRPLGGTSERQVDVRIICATNRDLQAEVAAGRFRQDLYYRLAVFPVRLPPLRERADDIPRLAAFFLRRYATEHRVNLPGFTQEALDALAAAPWPGNIRELENEVQRIVINAEPEHWVEVSDLSPRLRKVESTLGRVAPKKGTLKEMVEQVERALLIEALREHGGNKTRTAAALGITREGLHKKLDKLGL